MVDLCLNMDAKYVGRRTVTQQGAKSAAIPAKKEAINDALIRSSIILDLSTIYRAFDHVLSLEKDGPKDRLIQVK